jgi:hypothetical protein
MTNVYVFALSSLILGSSVKSPDVFLRTGVLMPSIEHEADQGADDGHRVDHDTLVHGFIRWVRHWWEEGCNQEEYQESHGNDVDRQSPFSEVELGLQKWLGGPMSPDNAPN